MHRALKDKTNEQPRTPVKAKKKTDKETVLAFIRDVSSSTGDFDLKYDLHKCMEILEGKENQEYRDLKNALEDVVLEKEMLFREKCELAVELDFLKSREKKQKGR